MKIPRDPLGNHSKLAVPAPSAMIVALDEMAYARGVKRSELVRRILAAAIVGDGPAALGTISGARLEELEYYADLWTASR